MTKELTLFQQELYDAAESWACAEQNPNTDWDTEKDKFRTLLQRAVDKDNLSLEDIGLKITVTNNAPTGYAEGILFKEDCND